MGNSNVKGKYPYLSTKEEIEDFNRSKWIEYNFLPTPGLEHDCSSDSHSIPHVYDWRFSPSGRTGVSLVKESDTDFIVMLLDVHNKLWFGNSIKIPDLEFHHIFTYHMLNETTLIVVEIREYTIVKQHIIKVNMETREAEFKQTVVHEFITRDTLPLNFRATSVPAAHVSIFAECEAYTVLVSKSEGANIAISMYLVPLNPLSMAKSMEFSVPFTINEESKQELNLLTGSDDHRTLFAYTAFSWAGLLYFPSLIFPGPPPLEGQDVIGVYFTFDVSKLIDIHNVPMDEIDQLTMNELQNESIELVSHNPVRFVASGRNDQLSFSYVYGGAMAKFEPLPSDRSKRTYYTPCQLLGSMRILKINTVSSSWLTLHPCGAVLQFKMSPNKIRLFVRVVSYWNNTLEAITSSKLIFHPNRPIDSIEGLYQIIFTRLKPILLDETTKKALETCRKCSNFEEFDHNDDSEAPNLLGIKVVHLLIFLAFGVPLMIFVITQFTSFMIQHNY